MNYKLAKQLKDAGFPQRHHQDEEADGYWEKDKNYDSLTHPRYIYIPTLFELIDACGDEFYILKRINNKSWVVEWRDGPCLVCETPEDAVAVFYLKLNKKNMTNEEILKKAIKKAKKNGCKKYHSDFVEEWSDDDIRSMITDHEFAKAFWGEELVCPLCGDKMRKCEEGFWCDCDIDHHNTPIKIGLWHLQQMVLEEEPLKYLSKFI